MKASLFGTSGIRGDSQKLFTPQFCYDIGQAFIEFLKTKKNLGSIAVGMDPRTSSPRIKDDLFLGLGTADTELFDEGVAPIPSINWLIINTPVKAAVMITGSHIAPELNGVKFYAHDEEISFEDQGEIEKIYFQLKEKQKPPQTKPEIEIETRAAELYAEMLVGMREKSLPKWKVAVDCANGSQSVVMPEVLQRLGLDVVKVNCDPQSDFIARDTDTDDKAGIEEVKEVVKKEKCDFGVAYDGDGDRVVFIDETGNFVQGEYSCGLIAKDSPSETIVTPISASQVVDKLDKKVVRTKVGSPYVIAAMKEHEAFFGFEPNGGAISAEIMYTRDGGSMTMKILTAFSEFQGTFSQMIGQLPKFYMARTKVDYKWELKEKIIAEAKKRFKGVKVEEVDGTKIWLNETTWVLFRSSQNAPEFRVFAESDSQARAQKLMNEGVKFVKGVIKSHG